jgi:hypothetical protein
MTPEQPLHRPRLLVHPDGRWAIKTPGASVWWVADDTPDRQPHATLTAPLDVDPAWIDAHGDTFTITELRLRLNRIATWHCRESFGGGLVGNYCVECHGRWPCDTYCMATEGRLPDIATC